MKLTAKILYSFICVLFISNSVEAQRPGPSSVGLYQVKGHYSRNSGIQLGETGILAGSQIKVPINQMGEYYITRTYNGFFVEFLPGSTNYGVLQELTGKYAWRENLTAYFCQKNEISIYVKGEQLLFAYRPGSQEEKKEWVLEKKPSSLASLAKDTRQPVDHLLGKWAFVNGATRKEVEFMEGYTHELIIDDGLEMYYLKRVGSDIEKYEGYSRKTRQKAVVVVISSAEVKIDFGSTSVSLTRVGGAVGATQKMALNNVGAGSVPSGSIPGADNMGINALTPTGDSKLHLAVRQGDVAKAKELIKLGITVNTKNQRGMTALHEAVQKGDRDLVELLLESSADVNAVDNQNKSSLDIAVQSGSTDMVQVLIDKGAQVAYASNALELAVKTRKTEIVTLMLNNGADANFALKKAQDNGNLELFENIMSSYAVSMTNSMFESAVSGKNFAIADLILSRGIDVNKAMDYVVTNDVPQMVRSAMAAGGSSDKALEYALNKRDATIATEAVTQYGANPTAVLNKAIEINHPTIISMLLQNGADPNQGLALAVEKNNTAITKQLLEQGASADAQMETAARKGSDEIVQAMIMFGGDPNKGAVPAAQEGHNRTAQVLVEAGADPNPVLPIAVSNNSVSLVQATLARGADPNAGMLTAITNGSNNIANMLLEAGANATDPVLVERACDQTNTAMVNALLQHGAAPDPGMPYAVNRNSTEIVGILLKAGANGAQPQYIATASGNTNKSMVRMLLDAGADPNAGIANAVSTGSTEVTLILINAGANGTSPEYMSSASRQGNSSLVQVLLDAGGDPNAGMQSAVDISSTEILEKLINAGANTSPASYMETAGKNGKIGIVNLLLRGGADPNPGMLPAVNGNFTDVVGRLIEAGANASDPAYVKAGAVHNNTELMAALYDAGADPTAALEPAVEVNAAKVVAQLVERGVDVTSTDLLVKAVMKNFLPTAQVLLEAGANPNEYLDPSNGQALIHTLALNGNLPMINLFILKGADLDLKVKGSEDTALHIAAAKGKDAEDMVEALVNGGADINAVNARDETVMKVAKSTKVKSILRNAGGKRKTN